MLFGISYVHWLVILSALITITGNLVYARDTFLGKTKPNRVTWLLWSSAPLLGTWAALSAGGDIWPNIRVFLAGFLPLGIFLLSFYNPKSYWKLGKFDFSSGVLAVLALILWWLTDIPQTAVIFLALADGFASLPTIVKSWKHPETETGFNYITALISILLIIPAIPVWNIENALFPMFLIAQNIALVFAIYRKRLLTLFGFHNL